MRFVEETGGSWTAAQLQAAEAEIEQQKREWEANRLAALKKEEEDEAKRAEGDENELLTYSREDAKNQVNTNRSKPVNRRLLKVRAMNRRNKIKNNCKASGRKVLRKRSNILIPTSSSNNSEHPNKKRKVLLKKSKGLTPPKRVRRRSNTRSSASDDANSTHDSNTSDDDSQTTATSLHVQGEDFNDSECSLDVMIDSQEDSESNSRKSNVSSSSENEDEKDEDEETADENESETNDDDDDEDSLNELQNGKENHTDDTPQNDLINHLDINSPRTRSRGTVKLNLWTLDDSPILPMRAKKDRSKNRSSELQNSSVDDSIEEHVENSSIKSLKHQLHVTNDDLSSSTTESDMNPVKHAKILDGFKNIKSPKVKKLVKNTKKIINGKSFNTLDSWISKSPKATSKLHKLIPKVMLSKDDANIAKHMQAVAEKERSNRTRRSSILKVNSENGPS